ncbi:MAG: hypothetical protein IPM47_09415 [Sphingobacteriales bacterium]|nr:MAG: hypothetical protein IPM47_09415 [Sphingobacteriales bacterium]
MDLIYSKSTLLLNSVLPILMYWYLCSPVYAQQNTNYSQFDKMLPIIDSTIFISNYDKVFIVHFNFCTSTKYCGQHLINYMLAAKGSRILVVCENTNAKILDPLKTSDRFEFKEISNLTLTQYGLFSVYNLLILPGKKKIKKLL